jgi:hypothetical protein
MSMNNIVFFGLSVTEASPGVVGKLKSRFLDREISKITFGGMHPNQVKFLFKDHLKKVDAKYVVLEWSTSAFRGWFTHKEYCTSFIFMIAAIIESKKIPMVVDFPRSDVDYSNDWVVNFHTRISRDVGIPYLDLTKKWKNYFDTYSDFLEDGIHANQAGLSFYADEVGDALEYLVANPVKLNVDNSVFDSHSEIANLFYCEKIADMAIDIEKYQTNIFSRSGYENELFVIPAGETIQLDTGSADWIIVGFTFISGPETGEFEISSEGTQLLQLQTYDQFCYYKRLSARIFHKHVSAISIRQSPVIPQVTLRKGVTNEEPRVGYIGDVFVVSSDYFETCDVLFKNIEQYIVHDRKPKRQ